MKGSMIILVKKEKQKHLFRNDLQRSEWLHQLDTFLSEGFSLLEALQVMELYEPEKRKNWLMRIHRALLNGEDFSSQLKYAGFSSNIVSYILFAEKYGDLQSALRTSSKILKKRYEVIQKSKRMLYYPLFLLSCLIVMSVVLAEGILPQFVGFFQSMDADLPLVTYLVIQFFSLFQLPILLAVLFILLLFLLWFRKLPLQRRLLLMLKIPLYRSYLKMYCTYYLVSQLSPLLNNGFSLHEALTILKNDSQVPFIQEEAMYFLTQLTNGEEFSKIVQERKYFEEQFPVMIRLGETKGKLGKELEQYGNFLFQRQNDQLRKWIAIAQPAIFASIGMIVIVLFLSMMMPIFNIMNSW